ncbi:MAG: hypothetical protein H0T42_24800 [Deltaproteobacteria bacterium]|nr:hypothetical protein [Deltaproteobacteria bacterium]
MSAPAWLGAMIAGSVLVVAVGARRDPAPQPEPPRPPLESPWLTREAAAEIIAPGGGMGPLFTGAELGGLAPSPEVRARIAEFARVNNIEIDFEISDDEVAAVRFEVAFGGCCGYEAADALALRLHRPRIGGGCFGTERSWIDDWAFATHDGVHGRARVRVNRLTVRWERMATFHELLVRAEGLLGKDRGAVSSAAGDRWKEIDTGRYLLEVPYLFIGSEWFEGYYPASEHGLLVVADRRRIVEVSFSIRGEDLERVPAVFQARWGRPRYRGATRTWRKPGGFFSAKLESNESRTLVTLRTR